MAIIDGLTTLAQVKLEAGIAALDTTNDSLIEQLISSCSSAVRVFLDRTLTKTTYTGEPYAVNNHQFLYLRNYPIQSVSAVTIAGAIKVLNVDYFMDAEDLKAGRIYAPLGWTGRLMARGTFPDGFAGMRDILISYIAGWILPDDVGYIAGASASLPLAISYAVTRAVITRFRTAQNQADGLKSLSEGGLSYTWFGPENYGKGAGGFDSITASMLTPFKRVEAY